MLEYNLETGLVISMLLQLTSSFKLDGSNLYTRKNAQVVTNLQTSCNKFVEKLLTCSHCLFLVSWNNFGTSC